MTERPERMPRGQCFISHAYDDAGALAGVRTLLPPGVDPVTFPKEECDPHAAVSNGIVELIRRCSSLVFLGGGASESSTWVNFERDYARRAGLPVFRYHPDERLLTRDLGAPVDLSPEFLVGKESFGRAQTLIAWLVEQRSFSFERRPTILRINEIPGQVLALLDRGAPVISAGRQQDGGRRRPCPHSR